MSKIIKARDDRGFTPFSFSAIESEGKVFHAAEKERADAPEEDEKETVEVDPLEEIERTIQQRLLDAERKAQEMEREAYEQGYAQGLKDGTEYGSKSMAIVKDHMEQLLAGMLALPEKAFKDYRNWLVAACIAVARKIVGTEISIQPDMIVNLVDALFLEAAEKQAVTLHLHPKDIDLLAKHTGFNDMMQQSERSFLMKPDPRIERGGCRFESEIQLIDATLEARFALIEEALSHHEPLPEEPSS